MRFHIRPSKLADAEVLGKIHAQGWQETYVGIMPQEILLSMGSVEARTAKRHATFASTTPLSAHFLVETDTQKIVGFGDCGPSHGMVEFAPAEIYALYLLREAQGQGLGKRLLFRMFGHLADKSFTEVGVKTHCKNVKAQQFYEYCGGKNVGEIPGKDWNRIAYVWPNIKEFAGA